MKQVAKQDGMPFSEAAKTLGVTWSTIKNWGEQGKLATYRRDGDTGPWLVSRLSVARLVNAAAKARGQALRRQSRVLKVSAPGAGAAKRRAS